MMRGFSPDSPPVDPPPRKRSSLPQGNGRPQQRLNQQNNGTTNNDTETTAQAARRLLARLEWRRRENARLDRQIVEREAHAEAELQERAERAPWIDTGNVISFAIARRRRLWS